ncbi:glycine zipper domain-containing protein [Steroidobacter agaridevorans]|uniref:glycine zipper domain-containing protein n=1 Tax=Steroidobacter agaridevorans TaxID=2695856 RepID=UPI00132931CA|nr:glycine zipper domain-containing protein [Steroidobacter agaridevorans]GFE86901.1 hypothetical protein GCM10011488_18550 [Steroidobacter agaridevorans]
MRARHRLLAVSFGLTIATTCAIAQTPIVYPAKKQTAEQQQKDTGECAAWAKQTTGVDPAVLAAAPAASAPPTPAAQPDADSKGPQGERVRGAARGAVAGAAVGEIADNDADKGAAVGATVGAVAAGGRARRESKEKQEKAAEQQEQAAAEQKAADQATEAKRQEQLATYNRANAACLEGRGYVLK